MSSSPSRRAAFTIALLGALAPAVTLADPPARASGGSAPAVAEAPTRLTSQRYKTWVWAEPRVDGRRLGYIRVGQSVALRSPERVPGEGCFKGFHQIEPRGYVCHDRTVTLERTTPFLEANALTDAAPGAFPYHFALSNGAPMYTRLPTANEQRRFEGKYGKAGTFLPLPMFQKGHEHLAVTDPIPASDPLPAFLAGGMSAYGKPLELVRRTLPHGSMLSYTRAFDHGGRTFLLSADLTLVPADRVRAFRRSHFTGVALGGPAGVRLPIAWVIGTPRPEYTRDAAGKLVPNGATFPVRSFVPVAEPAVEQDGHRYLPVSGRAGVYVDEADVSVVRRRTEYPFLVRPGGKWMLVSITKGTLEAYDDLEPVYTTLMSPGAGGLPRRGGNAVRDSTTPLGTYNITFKDLASTMSPEFGEDRKFWIADVPFTQYFNAPFALHGTYWHEKLGEPMSAGCVNLSLPDARWLFDWSDPQVPPGWQGVMGLAPENGGTTQVVVAQ